MGLCLSEHMAVCILLLCLHPPFSTLQERSGGHVWQHSHVTNLATDELAFSLSVLDISWWCLMTGYARTALLITNLSSLAALPACNMCFVVLEVLKVSLIM